MVCISWMAEPQADAKQSGTRERGGSMRGTQTRCDEGSSSWTWQIVIQGGVEMRTFPVGGKQDERVVFLVFATASVPTRRPV